MLARSQEDPRQGTGIYANLFHLAWGLPAYGATLLDGDGVVVLDQGEGTAGFLGWLETLDNEAGAYVEQDYGMLLDRFKKGEFAYFVDGPWAINELRGALGDSLTVMPLPAGPAGPAQPWLSADAMLINPAKSADQQQRALLVAQNVDRWCSRRSLGRDGTTAVCQSQSPQLSTIRCFRALLPRRSRPNPFPMRLKWTRFGGMRGTC